MLRRHKPRLFVYELIFDILLVTILCSFCVLFIAQQQKLTAESDLLSNAVSICSDVAKTYSGGNGSMDIILNEYENSIHINERLLIYLNDNFETCKREDSSFYLLMEQTSLSPNKIQIRFYELDGDVIYEITACHYDGITPAKIKEGNAS